VNATLRGLQVARKTLDRENELSFDARGLLRNEARLNADIRVSTLPEGLDPDEIVNQNPDEWAKLIAAAKPIVVHVMETLAANTDLNDPKAKTEVAEQVMPLIQDIPSLIERDTYRQQLARLLKVDESALVSSFQKPQRQRTRPRRKAASTPEPVAAPVTKPSESSPLHDVEAMCIGMILRKPANLYRVDRALIQSGLPRITSKDFLSTSHQEIIALIISSLDQDKLEPLNYVIEVMPIHIADYADTLLIKTQELVPQEERILTEIFRGVLRLRELTLRDKLNQYRFQLEDDQENDLGESTNLMKEIIQVNQLILKINKAMKNRTIFSNNLESEH
jgi:DNA primase